MDNFYLKENGLKKQAVKNYLIALGRRKPKLENLYQGVREMLYGLEIDVDEFFEREEIQEILIIG